jgi:hypothetical protein
MPPQTNRYITNHVTKFKATFVGGLSLIFIKDECSAGRKKRRLTIPQYLADFSISLRNSRIQRFTLFSQFAVSALSCALVVTGIFITHHGQEGMRRLSLTTAGSIRHS